MSGLDRAAKAVRHALKDAEWLLLDEQTNDVAHARRIAKAVVPADPDGGFTVPGPGFFMYAMAVKDRKWLLMLTLDRAAAGERANIQLMDAN